jgi:hypothetical protein
VEAGGVAVPARIYDLRSTFASDALAARVTVFELARIMGTSVDMIERHYGALLDGAGEGIAARLDALDAERDDVEEQDAARGPIVAQTATNRVSRGSGRLRRGATKCAVRTGDPGWSAANVYDACAASQAEGRGFEARLPLRRRPEVAQPSAVTTGRPLLPIRLVHSACIDAVRARPPSGGVSLETATFLPENRSVYRRPVGGVVCMP